MRRRSITLAAATAALAAPAAAGAHVSFHPNAIPQGAYVTTDVRVPNEIDNGAITSVRMKLPDGIITALADPPPGWTFRARTRKLAKPITTDDGTITTEVTEVDFTGGHTPPGQFVNLPIEMGLPASAKAGAVLRFPTVQTYSNGEVVRWIGPPSDEHPAPTVDVTKAGTAVLDVTGGDAGPPAKLPANLAGPSSGSSSGSAGASITGGFTGGPSAARTIVKKETSTLSIVALVVGALGLLTAIGTVGLSRRRSGS